MGQQSIAALARELGVSWHTANRLSHEPEAPASDPPIPKRSHQGPDLRLYEVSHEFHEPHFKIGLYADTHIGSAYEAEEERKNFYALCHAEGVTALYHAGDVVAGNGVYRGQIHELRPDCIGAQAQVERAARDFVGADLDIYFILGNHDLKWWMDYGFNVGTQIEDTARALGGERTIKCLGQASARINLGKEPCQCVLDLIHPSGGTAYAISYRAQKIAESYTGGDKPHVVSIGHFHKANELPHCRNMAAIQPGCFEWQTPFMRGKALEAHVAGCILEGWMEEVNGRPSMRRMRMEWAKYYAPARSAAG